MYIVFSSNQPIVLSICLANRLRMNFLKIAYHNLKDDRIGSIYKDKKVYFLQSRVKVEPASRQLFVIANCLYLGI